MLNLIYSMAIFASSLASTPPADYNAYLNRTYYTFSTVARDDAGRDRRLVVKFSHKGNRPAGRLDTALTLEMRSISTSYRTITAPFAIACNGRTIVARQTMHSLGALNAETFSVTAVSNSDEMRALTGCREARITIGGIAVNVPPAARVQILAIITFSSSAARSRY